MLRILSDKITAGDTNSSKSNQTNMRQYDMDFKTGMRRMLQVIDARETVI